MLTPWLQFKYSARGRIHRRRRHDVSGPTHTTIGTSGGRRSLPLLVVRGQKDEMFVQALWSTRVARPCQLLAYLPVFRLPSRVVGLLAHGAPQGLLVGLPLPETTLRLLPRAQRSIVTTLERVELAIWAEDATRRYRRRRSKLRRRTSFVGNHSTLCSNCLFLVSVCHNIRVVNDIF